MTVTRTGAACTWCNQQAGVAEFNGRCARCMAVFQMQDKILGKRWCRICGEKLVYPRGAETEHFVGDIERNQREISEHAVYSALVMLCDRPVCQEERTER